MHMPRFDRPTQRDTGREQSALADHVVERARTHAFGERTERLAFGRAIIGSAIGSEQIVDGNGRIRRGRTGPGHVVADRRRGAGRHISISADAAGSGGQSPDAAAAGGGTGGEPSKT